MTDHTTPLTELEQRELAHLYALAYSGDLDDPILAAKFGELNKRKRNADTLEFKRLTIGRVA